MDTAASLSERMVEEACDGYDSTHPLELVLLSVQVLGATLVQYTDILFAKNYWPVGRLLTTRLRPGTKLVDRLLIQAGWHRSQISRLSSNVLLRYYLSFISQDQDSQKHTQCNPEIGVDRHEKEIPIRPSHVFSSCNCYDIKVASQTLEHIIKTERIPLLSFSPEIMGEAALQVIGVTMTEIPEYFAISHIRVNGLGNSISNSLPLCQLERIQRLAAGLSKANGSPVLFWIDTLCIPLEAKLKKQALSHAREIFRNASAVLVLEPSLSSRIAGDAQECLLRIKYSPWTKRLWTIQEGALAREVYFEFKDSLPSLNSLITQYNRIPKVQQLLSCRTDHHQFSQRNEELLALLDIDLKHAYRAIAGDEYDKQRLRMMMRLGYLVFPQMCYFGEDDELKRGEIVMEALKSIYGELELSRQGQDSRILDQVSKDNIRRRLNLMEKTDLDQITAQPWNLEEAHQLDLLSH